jgi:hypothetical protein
MQSDAATSDEPHLNAATTVRSRMATHKWSWGTVLPVVAAPIVGILISNVVGLPFVGWIKAQGGAPLLLRLAASFAPLVVLSSLYGWRMAVRRRGSGSGVTLASLIPAAGVPVFPILVLSLGSTFDWVFARGRPDFHLDGTWSILVSYLLIVGVWLSVLLYMKDRSAWVGAAVALPVFVLAAFAFAFQTGCWAYHCF